jgi:phospholipid/cholesterol/gamma-HCH transport system ATP-binding protein
LDAIELIDIYTELGGERVLRGVSFGAPRDQITAILGPSGVGKTTCLRHVLGLLPPDQGDVLVEGRSTLTMRKGARLALSKRFGVLLQGSGVFGSALWEDMTVLENVVFQLNSLTDGLTEPELRRRALEHLHDVGLAAEADMHPAELSAGMRRRVALARALVSEPDFAVLDSFELGVDVVRLRGLCDMIESRHQQLGGTYLLATQSMEVARRLADQIVVLWEGRVIEQGPAGEVLESLQPEVKQLISGSTDGPLGMHGDVRRHTPQAQSHSHSRPMELPTEKDLELPIPLAAILILTAVTGSAVIFDHAGPIQLSVLAVVWLVAGVFLVLRYRRSG